MYVSLRTTSAGWVDLLRTSVKPTWTCSCSVIRSGKSCTQTCSCSLCRTCRAWDEGRRSWSCCKRERTCRPSCWTWCWWICSSEPEPQMKLKTGRWETFKTQSRETHQLEANHQEQQPAESDYNYNRIVRKSRRTCIEDERKSRIPQTCSWERVYKEASDGRRRNWCSSTTGRTCSVPCFWRLACLCLRLER